MSRKCWDAAGAVAGKNAIKTMETIKNRHKITKHIVRKIWHKYCPFLRSSRADNGAISVSCADLAT